MAYINEGDLIEVKQTWRGDWAKVIATSRDYSRTVAGTGEFVEDWTIVPSVDYIDPGNGCRGTAALRDVRKP